MDLEINAGGFAVVQQVRTGVRTTIRTAKWMGLALLMTACTKMCGVSHKDMGPEQVVEAYLNTAFNMTTPAEKEELMRYTTGNLKAAIAGATDETVRTAYIDRRYKITRYSVVERLDKTPRETQITFELVYRDLGTDKNVKAEDAAMVTTENALSMIRENGRWLIKDVVGAKTSIEFPLAAAGNIEAAKPK